MLPNDLSIAITLGYSRVRAKRSEVKVLALSLVGELVAALQRSSSNFELGSPTNS